MNRDDNLIDALESEDREQPHRRDYSTEYAVLVALALAVLYVVMKVAA